MATDLHLTVGARLRRARQRYTTGRKRLVETLARTSRPLTTVEIITSSGDLVQSSVYRNLAVLERAGVVHRVVGTDEFTRYELAEDLTTHHHHVICASCGAVEDFTLTPRVERAIADAAGDAADGAGYTAAHHRFDVIGLCAQCA